MPNGCVVVTALSETKKEDAPQPRPHRERRERARGRPRLRRRTLTGGGARGSQFVVKASGANSGNNGDERGHKPWSTLGFKRPARRVSLTLPNGAGAQRTFVTNFVKAQKPLLDAGKVQLLLNAGDHEHMRDAFVAALEAIGYGAKYATVSNKKVSTPSSVAAAAAPSRRWR